MQLKNIIFYLFIFSFPFTHAFAISGTINLSIILGSILFLFFLYRHKINISTPHVILYLFILNILVSIIVNIHVLNSKTLNHSVAWFTSILLFFIVPYSLFNEKVIIKGYRFLYISFYITIIFGIFEYLDVNILHLNIVKLIPRPSGEDYYPFFIAGIRSRSFFSESGYYGMYVALILPIILYIERGKLKKTRNLLLLIFTTIAMFFTFSTTFLILTVFSLSLIFLFHKKENFTLRFIFILIFILLVYFTFKETIDNIIDLAILSKFSSTSALSRESLNSESLNLMLENSSVIHLLFGYGPGSYEYLGIEAAISTYINLFRDLGALGLLFYIILYLYILIYLLRSKNLFSKYLLVSVISTLVYFQTNTSYYFAFIWFICILVLKSDLIVKYEKKIKYNNSML